MSALPQTTTTNTTQKKERKYAELATALSRMSRAIAQTADLCEQVHMDPPSDA
ncbi:hypothetical protein C8F01DRAFT_1360549 [Mycena amicta]|nr:hypothetical protein C8F01DRAFT_1360549 [Mycena amicta]